MSVGTDGKPKQPMVCGPTPGSAMWKKMIAADVAKRNLAIGRAKHKENVEKEKKTN